MVARSGDAQARPPDAAIRVLHVDDDAPFLDLASTFLERESERLEVRTAASAAAGLERLANERIDCIVSDYQMPGMDGIAFLERVRETAPDLPFLLFTGEGSEDIASEAISAGATDYLQKQGGTDQYTLLANRILNATERHRAERERERQLEAIENAHEGIAILDDRGHFRYVNDTYADLYGYAPDELLDEPLELVFSAAGAASIRADVLPTVEAENHWHGRTTGLRADGETFPQDLILSKTPHGDVVSLVRDLSEREEREQELARYETIIEALGDPVYAVDQEGRFTYVNEAYADVTGYSVDEILGEDLSFMADDATVQRANDAVATLLSSSTAAETQTYELAIETVEDETVHWEDNISLLPLEDGQYRGAAGVMRDFTDRRQRKAELETTNTVLRAVLENLPVGVLVEDADRDVLMANDTLCSVLPLSGSAEDLIGRDCVAAAEDVADRFADPEGFLSDIEDHIQAREPAQNEELRLADGRLLERDYVPYTLPSGEAHLWLYRDVTDRKRRERERERLRERVDFALRLTDSHIWEIDLETDEIDLYGDIESVLGVAPDAIDTSSAFLEAAVHPDDRPAVWEAYTAVRDGERDLFRVEYRTPPDGDSVRWLAAEGYRRTGEGQSRLVGLTTDVTEQKERERRLRRQNERLDEFASIVSHDLRSPLTVAGGRLELAREECNSRHLDDVADALDRSQALIDGLLQLARDGDRAGEVESVDLDALLEDCWRTTATGEATLRVETGQTIRADRNRLRQLLTNLFRNSVEHGSEAVVVTVGSLPDGFYVADDGPGIPPDARERVFEAGYSTSSDGTGLGLAIVERIATAHGWDVRVVEVDDGGTRFEITGVDVVED